MPQKTTAPFVLADALLAAFDTNDRINHYLLESLPEAAWRAEPPNGKGRDIASIVAAIGPLPEMASVTTTEVCRAPVADAVNVPCPSTGSLSPRSVKLM